MSQVPNSRLPIFSKLQTSISLALFRQEADEPQYQALDSMSNEAARFSRLSEYASDVIRIFRELELAKSLIEVLPPDEFFSTHDSTKEDYVMYHQGHFLDLVHQMKDKLIHLVDGLVHEPPFTEKEHADSNVLAEDDKVKVISGLSGLLKVWTQVPEAKHGIAVILRRRTQYHHFRNRLHLNSDFQDIKLFRTMQQESAQQILSDEGKKLIAEKGKAGFEKWHSEVLRRLGETTKEVQENIEAIATALLGNTPLPTLETEGKEIFDKYFASSESLKIKKVASSEHYKETLFYPIIKTIETVLPLLLGESLLSIYLIGSTTRGDAVRGLSDVNIVVVVRDSAEKVLPIIQKLIDGLATRTGEEIHLHTHNESTFKSNSQKSIRFTCHADGLLLHGTDLIGEEKFPKPGLELVCLFKDSAREIIKGIVAEVNKTPAPKQTEVTKLGRAAAKIGLRIMYWAVLADTARYERSAKGMRDAIDGKYPENKKMTDIFYGLVSGTGTVDLQNLKNLLSGFEDDSSLGKLMKQFDEKCTQLSKRKKH